MRLSPTTGRRTAAVARLSGPKPGRIGVQSPRLVLLYAVMDHMHDSVICICSKSAFREKFRPANLTNPYKISQAYVGRT